MTDSSQAEKRRNKQFIINNSYVLNNYAIANNKNLGTGIIIINLLFIRDDKLHKNEIAYYSVEDLAERNFSLQQAISYIPLDNFWFKIVRLKIKNKYNIDIKKDYDLEKKFLILFIKDAALENFSIYHVKLK